MPRPKPDPKLVAAVVGAWASGATEEFAAASNGVKLATAQHWIEEAKIRLEERLRARIDNPKRHDFQELFEDSLAENLRAQIVLARRFQDSDWVDAQGAEKLRELFIGVGILSDKSVRLGRAIAAHDDQLGGDGRGSGPTTVTGTYRELRAPDEG